LSSRHSAQSSKGEWDVTIIDDWTMNVSALLDQLDLDLEQAKMGSGRIESLVATLKSALEKVRTLIMFGHTLSSSLSLRREGWR
jgi:hypothetical protein